MRNFAVIATLLLLLAGCETGYPKKLYPGPERPSNEVARITREFTTVGVGHIETFFTLIDAYSGRNPDDDAVVLPGEYKIWVQACFDSNLGSWFTPSRECGEPQKLTLSAEGGHTYQVRSSLHNKPYIVDLDSGQIVAE